MPGQIFYPVLPISKSSQKQMSGEEDKNSVSV